MKKSNTLFFVGAVALVGFSIAPVVVSAQSVSATATTSGSSNIAALEAQITALLSQLTTLRGELNVAIGSSTPPMPSMPMMPASSTTSGMPMCPPFNRNLSIGSQGSDVTQLQSMLVQDANFPSGDVTGYFGPLTAKALVNFQTMNNIAASSSAAGFFGPLTRSFLQRRCVTLPGSNGGAVPPPQPTGTPPLPFQPGGPILPPTGTPTGMLSPTSGPVGTTVTISGVASSSELGTMETILMDGLVAAQNVSVAADGSLAFTVPSSLAPNCAPNQACPMFMLLTTPRPYQVSLIGQASATSTPPIQVGSFTVTGNGSSTFVSPAVPITPMMPQQ